MGNDHAKAYDAQLRDMVAREVARKLSREEMLNFEGPIHYLCYHEVVKPDLVSTPMRIVFNPRTDGGPGHLSTDGDGGADNRPPPGDLENEAS